MTGTDTVRLLRECDAGIKMGIESISDVLSFTKDKALYSVLSDCRADHEKLKEETQRLLDEYHDDGKDPNLMAKGMSWVKTNVKLAVDESDATIAGLMTDGCNMGIKSLRKYLNEYQTADRKARSIAARLIKIEEKLADDMSRYL